VATGDTTSKQDASTPRGMSPSCVYTSRHVTFVEDVFPFRAPLQQVCKRRLRSAMPTTPRTSRPSSHRLHAIQCQTRMQPRRSSMHTCHQTARLRPAAHLQAPRHHQHRTPRHVRPCHARARHPASQRLPSTAFQLRRHLHTHPLHPLHHNLSTPW
jgi:hypothetical protein